MQCVLHVGLTFCLPSSQFFLEMFPKGYADTLPASVKARVSVPPDGGRVSSVAYQLLPGAFFAVDTFFWMGGLLTAVALIKQMRKLGSRWWRLYPVYAVGRWVRLTPLLIVTLLWVIGVQEAAGDGPFWGTQQDRASCVESWCGSARYTSCCVWLMLQPWLPLAAGGSICCTCRISCS